jgi:DNA-binding CsgD family transcriptional regulator
MVGGKQSDGRPCGRARHGIRRLDEAIAGRGGLVLLGGEPGIGKTRLAEEVAELAHERGAGVLWGRCYEGEGAPAFWPWIEILRATIVHEPVTRLAADIGFGAAELAALVPEARERLTPRPSAVAETNGASVAHPTLDSAETRFRLFDAVTRYLRARAGRHPHLLILDDLQWADASSLLLLQFLARNVRGMPLMVLGAYRDVEVDRGHPLAATLTALNHERGYRHVALGGLSASATAALLEKAGPEETPSGTFTRALHDLTGGNPFFIHETLRHLEESGTLDRSSDSYPNAAPPLATLEIPEGVRSVVRQRMARLSGPAPDLLKAAAVIGREFDVATLSAAADETGLPVLLALDAAEGARLVAVEASGEGGLRYRFTHDVIRETLYADLARADRVRLHRRVGEALEQSRKADLAPRVSELAYHFVQAAPGGDATRAATYARRAGDQALGQFAYDEAARWYEQALDLLSRATSVDEASRCDLLLAHGEALLLGGKPRRAADVVAPAALALAETLGEAGGERAMRACRVALAALTRYAGPGPLAGSIPFRVWAERADRYAVPGTVDRVYADIMLADAHSSQGALAETLALYHRALALARELDDPDTLFFAAFRLLNWSGGPRHQLERLQLADEFSVRSRAGVSARNLGRALWRCGSILLNWGERDRAETLWGEVAELARYTREPDLLLFRPMGEAILAVLDGKLGEALQAVARLVERSDELGSSLYGRRFAARLQERPRQWLGPDVALPTALRGDLDLATRADVSEVERVAGVAVGLAQAGHLAEARRTLDEALEQLRTAPTDDAGFPGQLVRLLELTVLLEDRAAAEFMAERVAALAPCSTGDWALTTPARHLGAAALLRGDRSRAREYSEQALAAASRVRFRPEIALTSLQLAELLAHEPGEKRRAQSHLESALTELQDMNMRPALDRARRLLGRVGNTPLLPPTTDGAEELTARELQVLRLVAAGRSNREIADDLVVSARTVEHHIERIYRKIGVRRRVDATTYALRHGLASP